MTVKELIRDLLIEAGKDKRAAQIFKELDENDVGESYVGADVDADAIRYVDRIINEAPMYIGLKCEYID
jgi:hypothetical protein